MCLWCSTAIQWSKTAQSPLWPLTVPKGCSDSRSFGGGGGGLFPDDKIWGKKKKKTHNRNVFYPKNLTVASTFKHLKKCKVSSVHDVTGQTNVTNVVTMSADVSLKLESGKYYSGCHQQTSYWLLKMDVRLREQMVACHLCALCMWNNPMLFTVPAWGQITIYGLYIFI